MQFRMTYARVIVVQGSSQFQTKISWIASNDNISYWSRWIDVNFASLLACMLVSYLHKFVFVKTKRIWALRKIHSSSRNLNLFSMK